MTAIELDGITKQYGSLRAVDTLDLQINEGEVFGFLGPNGAGKSTTINIILDFVKPTAGQARVFGMDCQEEGQRLRQRIGVLPEGYDVYDRLTGRQHLEFAIESKEANDDPQELLERVGVAHAADRKASGYSKGMAQRLILAMALVGDPDLLILDEPTTGLDPNGAREIRQIIREENERGTTVFFSSHILGQVEAVCDRVGILREGRLVADDSIENLRSNMPGGQRLVVEGTGFSESVLDSIRGINGVESVTVETEGTVVAVGLGEDASKTAVLNEIEETGATVEDFETEEASLEDLFAAYTTEEEVRA
ncbi:ATP-binding cassette domain-containing protein [Halovenus sp. WSH3]|uniref:ATP-binding cassette domain-containing protein n=1 Tax=Halovenus carboxidivorans TaxID=2692199 RepID=A0A6B0TAF9_9EURY|nr:ABC transporter ATP-binding protein [Halovenus carboxidivorans]MXR53166.1 ATP-binding cassette domain-containing protein [Halovenus carboxidivorans]